MEHSGWGALGLVLLVLAVFLAIAGFPWWLLVVYAGVACIVIPTRHRPGAYVRDGEGPGGSRSDPGNLRPEGRERP